MRSLTFNRIIGTGSFGTVYRAELKVPRGFARQCAVKVMKATSPDQDHFRARMRDEARLLGMLADEQIIGVSELVTAGGRDIVVMEYVDGVDLSDIIVRHAMPPRALAELGAELAGTLHRAHSARHPNTDAPLQVVHRDVKPANVMITKRGGVRLLDFGVARAAFSSRESETQGLVLGTLNYFPPEILAGGDPTPAVDIYGVGLILWECATGKEWGSPQVHQGRFQRRVEQRIEALDESFGQLIPILTRILSWDPVLRPTGAEIESALLMAADNSTGAGLRTWARQVVPPILEEQLKRVGTDELLGVTLPLDLDYDAEQGALPIGSPPPQPPPSELPDLPEKAMESVTYNDLAPPAAVGRIRPAGPVTELELDPNSLGAEEGFDQPTELAIPRRFHSETSLVTQVVPNPLYQHDVRTPIRAGRTERPAPVSSGLSSLVAVVAVALVLGVVIGLVLVVLVLVLLVLLRIAT